MLIKDEISLIRQLLDGSREERDYTIGILTDISDDRRSEIASEIRTILIHEVDEKKRAWLITGLAALRKRKKTILTSTNPSKEPSSHVRLWATIALPMVFHGEKLRRNLACCGSDPDKRVRAVAYRLLIDIGYAKQYSKPLLDMLDSAKEEERFAASWSLQSKVFPGGTPSPNLQDRFIQHLVRHILDRSETVECRCIAIQALIGLDPEENLLKETLLNCVKSDQPIGVRRIAFGFLCEYQISVDPDLYLYEVVTSPEDDHLQTIAQTMSKHLGTDSAIGLIISAILESESPQPKYLQALRFISYVRAASQLSRYCASADRQVAERALQAIIDLGGEATALIYQLKRENRLLDYEQVIQRNDQIIMDEFRKSISQARLTIELSTFIYFGGLLSAVVLLIFGIFRIFFIDDQGNGIAFGSWFALIGGIILLTITVFRSPQKNVRQTMVDFGKINLIFMGFVRQMGQIDLAFKQAFLDGDAESQQKQDDYIGAIKNSVQTSMDEIGRLLNEIDELLR